jgi:hypothetical protein
VDVLRAISGNGELEKNENPLLWEARLELADCGRMVREGLPTNWTELSQSHPSFGLFNLRRLHQKLLLATNRLAPSLIRWCNHY